MTTPPDTRDEYLIGHIVTIGMWAGERIHDSDRREAFYRHLSGVFARYAATEAEQREILAAHARQRRTPSGLTERVTAALQVDHSRAETRRVNMDELVEQAELEHRDTPIIPDPRREPP